MRDEQTVKLGARVCRISDDEIRIPLPRLFGRGYLFDRMRQVVSISKRWIWHTSYTEVPFSNINFIAVAEIYHKGRDRFRDLWGSPGSTQPILDRFDFELVMLTSDDDREQFTIGKVSVLVSPAHVVSGDDVLERSIELEKGREPVALIAKAIGKVTGRPVRNV